MPLSIRLSPRIEQKLADYCVSHRVTKSAALQKALQQLLETAAPDTTPYALGREFFGRKGRPAKVIGLASKRLLRERFRGRTR